MRFYLNRKVALRWKVIESRYRSCKRRSMNWRVAEEIDLDACNYERYIVTMIQTFRHDGLKRYFETGNPKGLTAEMAKRIQVRLNVLNRAKELKDIALPGFGFHPLKGDREGEYSISVTGNYRMTFRFERGDVLDLNLEDYH